MVARIFLCYGLPRSPWRLVRAFGFWEPSLVSPLQVQSINRADIGLRNVGCGGEVSLKEVFRFCRRLQGWHQKDWSLVTEPVDWTPFPARNAAE
jgi:hypothetical protein